jgi:hypothetical protein
MPVAELRIQVGANKAAGCPIDFKLKPTIAPGINARSLAKALVKSKAQI